MTPTKTRRRAAFLRACLFTAGLGGLFRLHPRGGDEAGLRPALREVATVPAARGDGPIAKALSAKVPDFRHTVDNLDVFEIRRIIKKGKGIMPAFEPALEKYQIQDMVRMVRVLSMEGRGPGVVGGSSSLSSGPTARYRGNNVYDYESAGGEDKRS